VSRLPRKLWLVGLVVVTGAIALVSTAAPALANSASISVTNTGGTSDPASGVPRVYTLTGDAPVGEEIFVKYRAPGGAACAPTAHSDSGSLVPNEDGDYSWYGSAVNGSFSLQHADTWEPAGTFVFCIWLAPDETTVATPITQTITFRPPTGTITATVSPSTPTVDQQATATITGMSEAPEEVYAAIRVAGGAPCAPTYEADTGSGLVNGRDVNGAFSVSATFTEESAGSYVLCLWLASSSTDVSPVAGPQPETFSVVNVPTPPPPPPPCVVPAFGLANSLALVVASIHSGDCSVGRVAYSANVNVPRGDVVSLSPAPGTQLTAGSPVVVVVSTGRPCVAPSVRRGTRLSVVQRAIRAGHCSVGRSIGVHSAHVPKGTVVALTVRAGARLGTGALIGLVISSGPSTTRG